MSYQKKSRALGLCTTLGCFFLCCSWPEAVDAATVFFITKGVLWGWGGDLSNPWGGVFSASNGMFGLSFKLRL